MKMTPHEFMEKTVRDIAAKRRRIEEGKKQADMHCVENRNRIQKRLSNLRW